MNKDTKVQLITKSLLHLSILTKENTLEEALEYLNKTDENNINNKRKYASILDTTEEGIEWLVRNFYTIFKKKDIDAIYSFYKDEFNKANMDDKLEFFKQYLTPSEDEKKLLGEVFTPIPLIEEMLNKLPKEVWSNPDLKWLDPANGIGNFPIVIYQRLMKGLKSVIKDEEERRKHILKEMLYMVDISVKNTFICMNIFDPENKYDLNIYRGDFLTSDMKEVFGIEKFDIIVGNPPYKSSMYVDFLNKSFELSTIVLMIHPGTVYFNEKPTNKLKKIKKFKQYVENHLKYLTLLVSRQYFDIALWVPLVITLYDSKTYSSSINVIDKIRNKNYKFKDFNHITKWGNSTEYYSLKDKILSYTKDPNNLLYHTNNDGNFCITISQLRGHSYTELNKLYDDDFYTFVPRALKIKTEKNNKYGWNNFCFETYKEAENFLNYLKTNFARFCLSIYKIHMNLNRGELKSVPWLDFTQEWTDEKLYKFFNLNQEEIHFIEENIPKYYD